MIPAGPARRPRWPSFEISCFLVLWADGPSRTRSQAREECAAYRNALGKILIHAPQLSNPTLLTDIRQTPHFRGRRGKHAAPTNKNQHHMYKRLASIPAVLLASMLSLLAAGTANPEAVGIIDDAKATYDYGFPIAMGILGTGVALAIGLRLWNRYGKRV